MLRRRLRVGVEQVPDGEFIAGKCLEVRSAPSAVKKARSLAHEIGGAIAFGLRGEIEFGCPGSVEIFASFGELPTEAECLIGEV